MDHEAYRSQQITRPDGSVVSLPLAVHAALGHVVIPLSHSVTDIRALRKMHHLLLENVSGIAPHSINAFCRAAISIEHYLYFEEPIAGAQKPGDTDVLRLLSTAYHVLNLETPLGSLHRHALEVAAQQLRLGPLLSRDFVRLSDYIPRSNERSQ
jgi:hypothetical protein